MIRASRGILHAFGAGILLLIAAACSESSTPSPSVTPTAEAVILDIGVSNAAARVGEIIENDFASAQEDLVIRILVGNSRTLLRDLEQGLLDAVVVHHLEQFPQLWNSPFAMDGLVIITNMENPVEEMSIEELRRIFSTGIGPEMETIADVESISIFVPERGSGILELFQERVMDGQAITGSALVIPDSQIIPEIISRDPTSLGLTSMGTTNRNNVLPVEGVIPHPETVLDQSYPLSAPLYFVSQNEPAGELRILLAWLQSEAGQRALSEYYGRVR